MANKIKLQPVQGKYVSYDFGGKKYDIWLVNPETGDNGTYVPRDVALRLLASRTPIVSIVPVIKDGVFVQQLTADELGMIEKMKSNPEESSEIVPVGEERNKELEALVATQATQLEIMSREINELKKSKDKKTKKDKE